MQELAFIIAAVTGAFALAGVGFCAFALWAARDFGLAQRRLRPSSLAPSISILKPVHGLDPELREALRSHCVQQYGGAVELLVAVQSLADPAVPVVRSLMAEFPSMRIELVETPLVLGTNGKMSNLAQLLPHARHTLLLVSDADIAVGPHYLPRIVAPFASAVGGSETGLVTAPYSGRTQPAGRPTLGSRLEALAIATDFFPGVLTARYTEGVHFGLGSTLLMSRTALAAAGGFEALTGVLADDHALGARISAAGYAVILSAEPVTTAVPAYTFGAFWQHQLRWARTVRDLRPLSSLGLVLTHPVPWALLCLLATGFSLAAVVILLLALLARMAVAGMIGYGLLRDAQVLGDLALLPLRDCIALALWAWSYAGDTVVWRGERFRVRQGALHRVEPTKPVPGAAGIQ